MATSRLALVLRRGQQSLAKQAYSVLITSDHLHDHSPYRQVVKIGQHSIIADEPPSVGGLDEGPSPYQYLCTALGACTAMTMQMYAKRKSLPLEKIEVELNHKKVYAKDLEAAISSHISNSGAPAAKIDQFERIITLHGPKLTDSDRQRLFEIANKCPVHRTLESQSVITSSLTPRPAIKLAEAMITNSTSKIDPNYELMIPSRLAEIVPGFQVKRVLPYHRKRSISAFVFLDHFNNAVNEKSPEVGPHPHIGLATLTYLYEGAMLHRDSTGADAVITPGAVNYMISGKGCVHSERTQSVLSDIVPDAQGQRKQHGLQIWVALAKEEEQRTPAFIGIKADQVPEMTHLLQQTAIEGTTGTPHSQAKLVIGSFGNISTQIPVHPSLQFFLIDLKISPQTTIQLPLPTGIEYGIYNPFTIPVTCNNNHHHQSLQPEGASTAEKLLIREGDLPVFNTISEKSNSTSGAMSTLCLTNSHPTEFSRVAILGGVPLPEPRHIFWNFVATDKSMIRDAVEKWRTLDRVQFPKVINESNEDSIPAPNTTPRKE